MEAEEEEILLEELILEHKRLKVRYSHIDLHNRRFQLRCIQFRDVDDLEPQWKETKSS